MTFRASGFGLLAAAAIAAVSLGAGAAQASVSESVTIISPGSYSQSSNHVGLVTNAPTHPTSFCADSGGGLGGPGSIGGGGTGCGTVVTSQVTLKPAPSLLSYTASAADATDAGANLTYAVQVTNIGTATAVPLHLIGKIDLSASGNGARGEATIETTGIYGYVPTSCSAACVLPSDPRIIRQHWGCGTSEYDCDEIDFTLDFYVGPGLILGNGVGQVSLTTEARVFEGGGLFPLTARAFIDPIVTIDQSFLDLHPDAKVILSDDVGNGGSTGGVPEPATWALMIAGFGLAGSTLRRRKAALA